MLERLIASGEEHGTIKIGITPDEEVGRGAEHFDVQKFAADYAYTVDGGALGELEYENFNASGATVIIHGVSIHPGSAKDRMKNACRMAHEFHALLPADETPETTEGYEGFYHLTDISGDVEHAVIRYIIRDHDRAKFEARKETVRKAAETIEARYGKGSVTLKMADSYYNMREVIESCFYIVKCAEAAMLENGVTPISQPVRGGTTGAHLSQVGLPCPNLCTGGENFHSRFEFISVESMERITKIVETLAVMAGKVTAEDAQ
ncbi:MAG: peptidase T, partial [Clostridia bacterium]|nr:peptidase T [Clostridia bacterium]